MSHPYKCACRAIAARPYGQCAACSPSFGPYDATPAFITPAQADAFVAAEVAKLVDMPWRMVALHPDEAARITRKNAVAYCFGIDDVHGHRAARLFGMGDPRA